MRDLRVSVQCEKCGGSGQYGIVSPIMLRQERSYAGISLREMARRLKLSAAYLSDVERGNRHCPIRVEKAYSRLNKRK